MLGCQSGVVAIVYYNCCSECSNEYSESVIAVLPAAQPTPSAPGPALWSESPNLDRPSKAGKDKVPACEHLGFGPLPFCE